MSLKKELRQLELELSAMIERIQHLQMKVDSMEAQNSRLLERVNGEELQSEGEAELLKLYNEGYHICPTHFAKSREGEECLLCLAFMKGGN